ncbi:MAG: LLM class flavin-dependent oxidoreductase [Anaerolineaceae bacterium]|nr:LLM class flavin-dependent oxidoreductase [Anaerolineaceae bacterium]
MTIPTIGVIFHPTNPPEVLGEFARKAEAGGFDEVWLWEDSFWAGALTSAATMLAATSRIKVGIGLMPATVRNPLFFAMEITTLARLYPGRFLPGFGHGVDVWLKQMGAAPKSTMKALEETVNAVRALLLGESVTMHGDYVQFENVQLKVMPKQQPPLYIGAIREKSMQLAGRAGDGTILTEMASPAYVRWARDQIKIGMAQSGRSENKLVVFTYAKVDKDSQQARLPVRKILGETLSWARPHLTPLGIADEAAQLFDAVGPEKTAEQMPEAWLDEISSSGTPEQAAATIKRLGEAGADSIVLLPPKGDPACLDEYITYLMPLLKQ